MKVKDAKLARNKELVVFDLDGTLTPSKAPMEAAMTRLFMGLLRKKKIAVIGGGKYALFKTQLITPLRRCPKELFKNLFLFPTTSTSFYRYENGWRNIYTLNLSLEERTAIKKAFYDVFREVGYVHPKKVYGSVIEDRGTQVTFSALGQDVVRVLGKKKGVYLKDQWKRKYTPLKLKMAKLLARRLPKLEVHAAGFTSIDVTRKGIDKAYGLRQIEKYLHVPIRGMLFVGDAIFPGGNDYAVVKTGVDWMPVRGPQETARIIQNLLA